MRFQVGDHARVKITKGIFECGSQGEVLDVDERSGEVLFQSVGIMQWIRPELIEYIPKQEVRDPMQWGVAAFVVFVAFALAAALVALGSVLASWLGVVC